LTVTCSSTTHTECTCVSTATAVTRKRNSIILYTHCLSRCNICYLLLWSRCGLNNSVDNGHSVAVTLEEISQKTGTEPVPQARRNVCHYTRWKTSKRSM